MKDRNLIDLRQVEPSKPGYDNLYDQLEFGRFNSVKSGAAPTIYQEVVATAGQREVIIPNGRYTIGDHSLQVIVNGQVMRVGADNDYVETNSDRVTFTFDLFQNDVVVFRVNGGTSGPSLHEEQTAVAGQTEFNLIGSYTVGNSSLIVVVNGAWQAIVADYLETSPKVVTFTEGLEEGDRVLFRVEGLPSIQRKYEDNIVVQQFDNDKRIAHSETFGDTHVIKEFEYDPDGFPKRMIIREGGFIITKEYIWVDGINTEIRTTVREGT